VHNRIESIGTLLIKKRIYWYSFSIKIKHGYKELVWLSFGYSLVVISINNFYTTVIKFYVYSLINVSFFEAFSICLNPGQVFF